MSIEILPSLGDITWHRARVARRSGRRTTISRNTFSHFVIDEVDGADDISSFGFHTATGERQTKVKLVVSALSTICTPVIITSVFQQQLLHVAVEGSPTAARVLAAIQPVT